MRIQNVSTRRVSIGSLNVSLNPRQFATINTLKGLASEELQSFVNSGTISIISMFSSGQTPMDTFVSTETDEGALTPAQVTDLTDGGASTLHFHASDRARATHTGTQTKATISDFAHGAADHAGAIGTLSQISDVTIAVADLNSLDSGADSTLHFHDSDRDRANHTGTQTLATISDVTIAVADLNTLDDGANTALHFHDTDRDRANHTGTQTLATIRDVTVTAANLNAYLPSSGTTAARPAAPATGFMYFDTDLGANGGRPIWWNGAAWVYSDGALV